MPRAPRIILPPEEERVERVIKMTVAYDGTEYHGWQRQANGLSVQEVIETKLAALFNTDIRIQGSSRTDAGVHALGLVASFRAPKCPYLPDWKIRKALNRLLPPSVKIRSVEIMEDDSFNARFSAKGKAYAYLVNMGDPSPFSGRWCHHISDMVDIEGIRKGLEYVQGTHDYSAFTIQLKEEMDHVRTIYKTELLTFGNLLCFHIVGNGFLYKMVRSISGTLIDIGRGKIPPENIQKALETLDRQYTRDVAPAQGLFLLKVFYEEDEWKKHTLEELPFHTFF